MDRDLAPGMASELKVIEELRRRNIPFQHRVQIDHYEVDILVGRRIAIEVDGYVHAAKETIEKDERKSLYLEDQGFIVMRITGNEVRNRGLVRDFGRRIQERYRGEQAGGTSSQSAKPLTQSLAHDSLLQFRQQMDIEARQKFKEQKNAKSKTKKVVSSTPQQGTGEQKKPKAEEDNELFQQWARNGPFFDKDGQE